MPVGGIIDGDAGMSTEKTSVVPENNEVDETPVPHDPGSLKTNSEPVSETIVKKTYSHDMVPTEGVHMVVMSS